MHTRKSFVNHSTRRGSIVCCKCMPPRSHSEIFEVILRRSGKWTRKRRSRCSECSHEGTREPQQVEMLQPLNSCSLVVVMISQHHGLIILGSSGCWFASPEHAEAVAGGFPRSRAANPHEDLVRPPVEVSSEP